MTISLQHPIPGARMTDRFGWRPAIPGVIGAGLHNGQDYAAGSGTLIRAAQAGTVTYNGWDPTGGGNMLRIDHGGGYQTLYLHMRERSPLVNAGQRVAAGQGIGYVGSSGASTGPHLHFMLERNGSYIDPVPYIKTTTTPKPPATTPKPKEEESMYYIQTSAQGSKWVVSTITGHKRLVGSPEWSRIRSAEGKGLVVPLITVTDAVVKSIPNA